MLFSLTRRVSTNFRGLQSIARYSKGGQCEKPKIAVVLSGCGIYDGSEIHEAVAVLSHITRNKASPCVFAPCIPQLHTINHATGEEDTASARNVLVESARISRGQIKPLTDLAKNYKNFQAVVFPGGFGVAKNLSDFAVKGPDCAVIPEVAAIIKGCHAAKIPLGFACIAPILAAKVLCNVTITLGESSPAEQWPHNGAIEAAEKMGATLEGKKVNQVSHDRQNNVFSTPAFMFNGEYHEIDDGIGCMIEAMLEKN